MVRFFQSVVRFLVLDCRVRAAIAAGLQSSERNRAMNRAVHSFYCIATFISVYSSTQLRPIHVIMREKKLQNPINSSITTTR